MGRKTILDRKVQVAICIPISKIVGTTNLEIDTKSPEYKAMLEKFKDMLYETVDFLAVKEV